MFTLTATRITAVCVFIGCAIGYAVTLTYPAGAARLPEGLLILMGLCSVMLLFRKPADNERPFVLSNPKSFLLGTILSFAYVAAIYVIGYYAASILFIISLACSLRYKKRLTLVAVACLYVLTIYVSFQFLLKIPMPQGLLL